jgi:hypothetical protein
VWAEEVFEALWPMVADYQSLEVRGYTVVVGEFPEREGKVQKNSFTGLFVFLGQGGAEGKLASILQVVLGVSEDRHNEGW